MTTTIKFEPNSLRKMAEYLYDGTLDNNMPNNIKVTSKTFERNGNKTIFGHMITSVLVFKKYIVIYFDYTSDQMSDSRVIRKIETDNETNTYEISYKDTTNVFDPLFFIYDHILFVLCIADNIMHIIQPDTNARTKTTIVRDHSYKTFKENSLTTFLNMYKRLPYGHNRQYDPKLMEWPVVICPAKKVRSPYAISKWHPDIFIMVNQ